MLNVLGDENLVRAVQAQPMGTFVPRPGLQVHDGLNDDWFTLTPEMAESITHEGFREPYRGVVNWGGLILDGWLPAEPHGVVDG